MEILQDNDQVSLGDLNSTSKENSSDLFGDARVDFVDLSPREIQPVQEIPDYLDDTILDYPAIVELHGAYYCIDGWNLIEKAISKGKENIRCEVSKLQGCSKIELGIRKVAIRLIPKGGKPRYAEVIRNVKILYKELLASNENLAVYTHGGVRKGIKFTNNKEENVRLVLAKRLGKSTKSISSYLSYGEYLTDKALQKLAEKNARKKFFEDFQKIKSMMLIELLDKRTPKEKISSLISAKILEVFPNFKKSKSLRADLLQAEKEKSAAKGISKPAAQQEEFLLKKEDYWRGRQEEETGANVTNKDEARKKIFEILEIVMQRKEELCSPDISWAEFRNEIIQCLRKISEHLNTV